MELANSGLQNLSEIFNNCFFRIPDYQRGYAWKEEQLIDFWNDVYYLDENKSHYTGLITVKNVAKSDVAALENLEKWKDDLWLFDKGLKAYYIIDGQQRILTIIVLLKTILDRFNDTEEINYTTKASFYEKYFYQKAEKHESFIFGYERDDPSNDYYKIKILEKPTEPIPQITETLYTSNLNNAKHFFKDKIKDMPKSELQLIVKKLVNNLKFNLYEIDDELDVCITFETMNNRGKSLSKLEILKNRLIYLSTLLQNDPEDKRQLRKRINKVWKNIYEYLGKNQNEPLDDDEFLENHWRIYFKYTREEGRAFSKFLLDKFFTSINVTAPPSPDIQISYDVIKNYISSLSDCVVAWYYIFNPKSSNLNSEIIEWLLKLQRMDNKSMLPLVMAAIAKGENEDNLLKLIKSIERFDFLIFKVTDRKASTGNSHFYSLGHEYYYGNINITKLIHEIDDFINEDPYGFDIKVFENTIDTLFEKQNGFYSWNGLNYFLYEYELSQQIKNAEDIKVSWGFANKIDSIEHIFPQEPKSASWSKEFTNRKPKEKKYLTNSLGNLVLISSIKNSELRNESFEYKRKHINKRGNEAGYFNGSYSEIEIAQYPEWSPMNIYKRGKGLLHYMERRWDIDIPDIDSLLHLEFLL